MYTFPQIRELVLAMQADQGPLVAKMRDILTRYEGDWVIPLPDVVNEPKIPQLTPMLIGEAIDQIALRSASVRPNVVCPPINPSRTNGPGSREYANTRRRIIEATYANSRWSLGRRRYYRQMTAYYTASLVVVPDFKAAVPRLEVRDPLASYVEPASIESLRDPAYAAFITQYSGEHLRRYWPDTAEERGGPIAKQNVKQLWSVVEWFDEEDQVIGLLGPIEDFGSHIARVDHSPLGGPYLELARFPNRAGRVPVCVPHNVSLGRIASRVGAMIGSVDLQAKLAALSVIAQEKAIFPDVYIIGRQNAQPGLVDGEWKDGRSGDINRLVDVDNVGVLRTTADPATGQMIDRLERNFRASTSLVPQFGGETYGALRTGRGIDALAGIALDPRVQENHEISESYLPALNAAILATYKGYWPNKQYSMYTGRGNDRRLVEFVPSKHIENTENTVSYFIAGADVLQVTQVLGSLFGAGAISERTFREQHPMIDDADAEAAQRREEELSTAAMQALQQQILSGQLPPTVAGMIHDELVKGATVFEAIERVDRKMRELQATPAAPPAPEDPMAMAPESMPGLTGGPTADQQPMMAPQVQVPADASRMRQLIQTMGA